MAICTINTVWKDTVLEENKVKQLHLVVVFVFLKNFQNMFDFIVSNLLS